MHVDESSKGYGDDSNDSNDSFAFLLPTSSKFPRKTMVMGGGTSSQALNSSQILDDPIVEDQDALTNLSNQDDSSQTSAFSTYSYVSIYICISYAYVTRDDYRRQ